jgi:hypothetical protein
MGNLSLGRIGDQDGGPYPGLQEGKGGGEGDRRLIGLPASIGHHPVMFPDPVFSGQRCDGIDVRFMGFPLGTSMPGQLFHLGLELRIQGLSAGLLDDPDQR